LGGSLAANANLAYNAITNIFNTAPTTIIGNGLLGAQLTIQGINPTNSGADEPLYITFQGSDGVTRAYTGMYINGQNTYGVVIDGSDARFILNVNGSSPLIAYPSYINFNANLDIQSGYSVNVSSAGIRFSDNTVQTTAATAGGGSSTVINSTTNTATSNQTSFTLIANVNSASYVIVTVNGLVQVPNTHYSIVNNALTFVTGLNAGDLVESREFVSSNIAVTQAPPVYTKNLILNTLIFG
jgi:hypothetical protein